MRVPSSAWQASSCRSRRFGGSAPGFFQRKCELLRFEIDRSGKQPTQWEKEGVSLYTVRNAKKYSELRRFSFRLFDRIRNSGGFLFYVGSRKTYPTGADDPEKTVWLHVGRSHQKARSVLHHKLPTGPELPAGARRTHSAFEADHQCVQKHVWRNASAELDGTALSGRKSSLSDDASGRLDRGRGRSPWGHLESPEGISREPGIPNLLRISLAPGIAPQRHQAVNRRRPLHTSPSPAGARYRGAMTRRANRRRRHP